MIDLRLGIAVLLVGSTFFGFTQVHASAVVEHSLDSGKSFQRIGVIHLHDDIKGNQPIVTGSYERQPVTETQLNQLKQLVEGDRLYLWRVHLEGQPAVQTSIKAACLAEHFLEQVPALTLSESGSIISAQLTVPTAPDGSCSPSRGLQVLRLLPQEELLEPDALSVAVKTPATGPSVPKWPLAADAPDVLASAGGARPAGQQPASQQQHRAAGANQQQGSQEQQERAEGEQPAPPPDNRTWLQKNWLIVMAGGMMVVNMVLKAAVGDMPPPGQQGRPGPARPAGAPVRR